jgi:pantoate--beta-alanine ligase
VISIFVNPTQFGPADDLERYPRDVERDTRLAEEIGVDYLFNPAAEEMYAEDFSTWVNVERLTEGMCGAFRPGHFRGVATVVAKLFNIVRPDRAYFGEKDYQQLAVIKRMTRDLDFDLEVVGLPLVREADGLALSSRNVYLNASERKAALALSKSLKIGQNLYQAGERQSGVIGERIHDMLDQEPLIELEYLVIADTETLEELTEIKDGAVIALAAKVGKTRLIDNTVLGRGSDI